MLLQETIVTNGWPTINRENTNNSIQNHTLSTELHICTHLFCCNTGALMHHTGSHPFIENSSPPYHTKLYSFPVWVKNKAAPAKWKQQTEEDPVWPTRRKQILLRSIQCWSSDLIAVQKESINTQCMSVQKASFSLRWDVKQRGFLRNQKGASLKWASNHNCSAQMS